MRYVGLLVTVLAVLGVLLSGTSVLAQGAGITLRPATIEERIDPGTEKQFTVLIKNESDSEQLYYLGKRDIVGVRDGSVPVFRDRDIAPTGYDMSQWISLWQDTVQVPAGGEAPIQFSIKVPQDAPPCSHFAGIFVSVEPPDLRESGASIGYEVANIISLRVSGECQESAQIRQFSTDNYLYGSPKVNFNIRIEYTGNTLIRPTVPVEITNMFGQEVGKGLVFNDSGAAVFPKDTREYTFEWLGEGYGFGRYEAVVSPVYGEEGNKQTMSSTVTFWILPMAIILPALGALLVAFLIVYFSVTLYVRRKLAYYQAVGGRRVVQRRAETGSPLLLIFLVMLTVTAIFFMGLLILFA